MALVRVIYFRLARDDFHKMDSDDRRRLLMILRWAPDDPTIMDHIGRRMLRTLREGDVVKLSDVSQIEAYLDLLRARYQAQADDTAEEAKTASTGRFLNELAHEALRDITATRLMLERA